MAEFHLPYKTVSSTEYEVLYNFVIMLFRVRALHDCNLSQNY